MSEIGTLFGIGVGPGDAELLTIKALHIIQSSSVIVSRMTSLNEVSYGLSIVEPYLKPGQEVLRLLMPMSKDKVENEKAHNSAARQLVAILDGGKDIAFLTEGDPLFFSTFEYILHRLPDYVPVEIVPGVSSMMAAAASARFPLAVTDQRLAILPANYETIATLRQVLLDFDTVVLLKVHPVLDDIIHILEEMGLAERSVLVERASHPLQKVYTDITALRGKKVHYFSIMLIHANWKGVE